VAQQEIGVKAVNVSAQVAVERTGWEVAHRVESDGAQNEASKRDLVAHIHDCGEISAGRHPMDLHYCCESHAASGCTDVLGAGRPAYRRSATRRLV
jgi:hypothetical protein